MNRYIFKDHLTYERAERTYRGEWQFGDQRFELTIPPPSIEDNLGRAEDCMRGLEERWDENWMGIVDATMSALREFEYPGFSDSWRDSIQLEGIWVHLNSDRKMEAWLTIGLPGYLPEDEIVQVVLNSTGEVVNAEHVSLF